MCSLGPAASEGLVVSSVWLAVCVSVCHLFKCLVSGVSLRGVSLCLRGSVLSLRVSGVFWLWSCLHYWVELRVWLCVPGAWPYSPGLNLCVCRWLSMVVPAPATRTTSSYPQAPLRFD